MASQQIYGTIARFETAAQLVGAAAAARKAGYRHLDAFAPFPVPGLAPALGFRERRIPALALLFGILGAAAGFFTQWYSAVIDYPIVVGGKPLASWQAFLPVTFETGVLSGVLAAIIAMLIGNRLPQPYHPVFNDSEFDRASGDGFFLLIPSVSATAEERTTTHDFLKGEGALNIRELEP